jgi:exosortase
MSEIRQGCRSLRELSPIARTTLALLGLAIVAWCIRLWPQWRHNPDLSHGFFMPVIFVLLLIEARRAGGPFVRARAFTRWCRRALLAGALLGVFAAGLYAASVDWSHALVDGSLTVALVCLLTAAALVFADERVRFLPAVWPVAIALLLWFLAVPIPPGTYTRLTMSLQLWVTEAVLRSLHVLGIAAIRHGNIIELARATVGVEEACSGIRSLISCVFAGLFFSGTLVSRPWARALIILLSAPLAIGMNFLRSLTLTILASEGVDISGAWHDGTGFAVLGLTAALLAGFAVLLERLSQASSTRRQEETLETRSAGPTAADATEKRAPFRGIIVTAALAGLLIAFCVANTHQSPRAGYSAPNLEQLLPAAATGWSASATDNLYEFRGTLQTDHLAQRIYKRVSGDGATTEIILYVAYWAPGQAPVSLVASHTPEACWPGSGWTMQPVAQPQVALKVDNRVLAPAEYRAFTFNGFPQYVWFWHLYDGHPIAFRDPYSPIALLRLALTYGFRHNGDQLFVRVSSNRPWQEIEREPLVQYFFGRVKALGL